VLTAAGLIQGNGWLNGQVVYKILPEIHVYMVLRAAIGLLIVGGAVLGLTNIYLSIYRPSGVEGSSPDRKGEAL